MNQHDHLEADPLQDGIAEPVPSNAPHNITETYATLSKAFRSDKEPVNVSFRKMVSAFAYGDRATHFIHPYPAKLLAHIPYFFLNNPSICPPGSQVLDPFCGSGTTLLEATIAGHRATGIDVNPFAAFVAKAKTSTISSTWLRSMSEIAIAARCSRSRAKSSLPNIPNPKLWYTANGLLELSRLREGILQCENAKYRSVMMVILSLTARSLSLADPRMPVPVRVRMKNAVSPTLRRRFLSVFRTAREADAVGEFRTAVEKTAKRYEAYRQLLLESGYSPAVSVHCDSVTHPKSTLNSELNESTDIIITSPPYCGAQKYVRSSSLSLGWLNLAHAEELADLEQATVGRERIRRATASSNLDGLPSELIALIRKVQQENTMRGAIITEYFIDMKRAFTNTTSWLKPGGRMILVVGDSYVCGHKVPTSEILRSFLHDLGMSTELILRDNIVSRGLLMARKGTETAITTEQIMVLRKER